MVVYIMLNQGYLELEKSDDDMIQLNLTKAGIDHFVVPWIETIPITDI